MSLVAGADFQHILRILNTNVDGREKVKTNGKKKKAISTYIV